MAYFERIRDVVSGPFSPDLIQQRTAAGWQLVSVEWRREMPGDAPASGGILGGVFDEDIPYGLRISDDCKRLEVESREHAAMVLMMELLVQDFPLSSVVSDLNEKGFRTREGKAWSRISVFNMLPRLIEIGPTLFPSHEWEERRQKFARMI
ncbi:MAG TPA: recombinase family protein [Acidobacteriaceae bacterium]|nr:recombinase family protein [Acidobacteriaceae bacterium]